MNKIETTVTPIASDKTSDASEKFMDAAKSALQKLHDDFKSCPKGPNISDNPPPVSGNPPPVSGNPPPVSDSPPPVSGNPEEKQEVKWEADNEGNLTLTGTDGWDRLENKHDGTTINSKSGEREYIDNSGDDVTVNISGGYVRSRGEDGVINVVKNENPYDSDGDKISSGVDVDLWADSGTTTVNLGEGNSDIINYGNGNLRANDGSGNDRIMLKENQGNDTIIFDKNDGNSGGSDRIDNFEPGYDQIQFKGLSDNEVSRIKVTKDGDDVVVIYETDGKINTVTVTGVSVDDVKNNLFVNGQTPLSD